MRQIPSRKSENQSAAMETPNTLKTFVRCQTSMGLTHCSGEGAFQTLERGGLCQANTGSALTCRPQTASQLCLRQFRARKPTSCQVWIELRCKQVMGDICVRCVHKNVQKERTFHFLGKLAGAAPLLLKHACEFTLLWVTGHARPCHHCTKALAQRRLLC